MDKVQIMKDIIEQLTASATYDLGDYVDDNGDYINFNKWSRKMRLAAKDIMKSQDGRIAKIVFRDKDKALDMLCKLGEVGAFKKGESEERAMKLGRILEKNKNKKLIDLVK